MNPAMVGDLENMGPYGNAAYKSMTTMIGSNWKLFTKVSSLNCIGTANVWVFADESMCSLNDGYLECNLTVPGAYHSSQSGYPDIPAAYHSGGNCFSFADGHVEYKAWKYTDPTPGYSLKNVPYAKNTKDNRWGSSGLDVDWIWLRQRTSCLK